MTAETPPPDELRAAETAKQTPITNEIPPFEDDPPPVIVFEWTEGEPSERVSVTSPVTPLAIQSAIGDKPGDVRLYVPHDEGWEPHIKRGIERWFCFAKNPGEEYFHLILPGEIFLTRGHEMYCLKCALRRGDITTDRLFWQHRVPRLPPL